MNDPSGQSEIVPGQRVFLTICLCFFLSGFAALLYETVWVRQFAIILGTSEQALAVILGAYMGGLSLGAYLASRWVNSIRRPVLTYGILEAGIAICALAMPWGLTIVQWIQLKLFGGTPEPPPASDPGLITFGLVSSFSLILPPTAMMGATLPLLAKYVVHRDRELGPRIGWLYAINTLGAVAGTLAAAFLLMPTLGLSNTTWVGAAVNFSVFALVCVAIKEPNGAAAAAISDDQTSAALRSASAVAARGSSPRKRGQSERQVSDRDSSEEDSLPYGRILGFIAISGGVSFCYEIVFTRMLGHFLGGSIFAFATMLAGFLLGIALGGAVASRLAVNRTRSVVYFAYAQALIGIFAVAAFWSINSAAGWSLESLGGRTSTFARVVVSILLLLPTATCIGATFPLAIRIFARDEREASISSAKVYFWNTIGSITGSLLTGMLVLPLLQYHGSIIFAIVINAAMAVAIVFSMRIDKLHAMTGAVALAVLLLAIPTAPEQVLRVSALTGQPVEGDFLFNNTGRSATVSVFRDVGALKFQTNGLPEAAAARRGAGLPYLFDGAWLSALPVLVRPGCESMLIVGLGGGVAASFVPPSVKEFDVFELEPSVVDANRRIGPLRYRDPFHDPRMTVILNDGRNGLRLTSKTYDAIVSQPSHPWTAGASHLYTLEYNQIVRDRLNPGGVFLQWMDVKFLDVELLRSMSASLLAVFPHVRVYEPTKGSMLFVASDQPIEPEKIEHEYLRIAPEDLQFFREFGMIKPTDLLAFLKMDESALHEFSQGAQLTTDEHNLFATRSPQLLGPNQDKQAATALRNWEPITFYGDRLRNLCPTLDMRAFGIRLRARQDDYDSELIAALFENPVDRALFQATLSQFRGDPSGFAERLHAASDLDPDDPRAAYMILAYSTLKMLADVSPAEEQDLAGRLDPQYRRLLDLVKQYSKNNLQALREEDEFLSTFEPDQIGYDFASRMRIVWRIRSSGPKTKQHNAEAVQIAMESSPTLGPESVALFQTVAALQSGQPYVALSTLTHLAKSIGDRAKIIDKGEQTAENVRALFPLLAKCRKAVSDPSYFSQVSEQRYREDIDFVDSVLRRFP